MSPPGRSPRLRRDHRQAGVAVPYRPASGRVRLRDVAEGRVQVRRRRNTWGEITIDDEARASRTFPTGSPTYDYYGADRPGANLFGSSLVALDARTGKRLVALPDVHHDLWDYDNNAAPQLTTIKHERQDHRRGRAGRQDRIPLRLRSRDRRADLADRGTAGAEERHARRTVLADAAVPDRPAALQQADVHCRRHQPVSDRQRRGTREVQAAPRRFAQSGTVHAHPFRRHAAHPGQQRRGALRVHGGGADQRRRLRHQPGQPGHPPPGQDPAGRRPSRRRRVPARVRRLPRAGPRRHTERAVPAGRAGPSRRGDGTRRRS